MQTLLETLQIPEGRGENYPIISGFNGPPSGVRHSEKKCRRLSTDLILLKNDLFFPRRSFVSYPFRKHYCTWTDLYEVCPQSLYFSLSPPPPRILPLLSLVLASLSLSLQVRDTASHKCPKYYDVCPFFMCPKYCIYFLWTFIFSKRTWSEYLVLNYIYEYMHHYCKT